MQKDETIINQFVRTIKESPLDVKGDPILLNKIFDELDKRKKRRRFFQVFFSLSFVVVGVCFVAWGINFRNNITPVSKSTIVPLKHLAFHIPRIEVTEPIAGIEEKVKVPVHKKTKQAIDKKQDNDFTNVVSYKFNDHQVDVFNNGEEEFIQINVFGADGVEQDVLKIMEDLKKSYRNHEVYVDSVKHK